MLYKKNKGKIKVKNIVLITGAVLTGDKKLVATYNNIISLIDNNKYEILNPIVTMNFKGNYFE